MAGLMQRCTTSLVAISLEQMDLKELMMLHGSSKELNPRHLSLGSWMVAPVQKVAGYSSYLTRLVKETERTEKKAHLASLLSAQQRFTEAADRLDKAAREEDAAAAKFKQYLDLEPPDTADPTGITTTDGTTTNPKPAADDASKADVTPLDTRAPPPQNITLDDYAESKGLQGSSIAMAAVTVHNVLRRQHGAPLLQWSDECAEYAQKQADECQCNGGLSHGSTEAPSGSHGQNLAWSSAGIGAGWSVEKAVRSWYGEIEEYDWSQPGFQSGTGHFTQVIWKSTTHVGVGVSTDGKNIAANYYPAGNVQGRFPENVEPLLQGM